jgi:hypothetical protein
MAKYIMVRLTQYLLDFNIVLTADEASILEYQFLLLLFASQVRKGVNDDTKNKVQDNNDDNEEEQQVINNSSHKEGFLYKEQQYSISPMLEMCTRITYI